MGKGKMIKLGVNVDHIATVRQARGTLYPDPVVAALLAENAGCDSIVVHLREDRRHIQERDVFLIKEAVNIPLNLEMSVNTNIVSFACQLCPDQATLVPERRQELTTEGGIDVIKNYKKINGAVKKLKDKNIKVSLFIDPLKKQIKAARDIGADIVEFNTGAFSECKTEAAELREINKIRAAVDYAAEKGFFVAAGHGIDYQNVEKILVVKNIEELNIGHSIISRALFIGMIEAVNEMIGKIRE
jgi:pyridoxine 5-phosphate synthase